MTAIMEGVVAGEKGRTRAYERIRELIDARLGDGARVGERLHERGRVFYLRSLPEDVYRRLRHDRTRPLLQVADPLRKLRELFRCWASSTTFWIFQKSKPAR